MKFIKNIPVAVCGLALSLGVLGNLLLPYGKVLHYMCGLLSAALLLIFILKLFLAFELVREELKNPVALSVLPTATMTLMLLCTYIKPYVGAAAVFLWSAAVIMHLYLMLLFAKQFILNFKIQTVFPSWFLVCVGIVAVSVTGPLMGAKLIGLIALYLGLILYLIMLPIVIYRMIKVKPLPEPARPTIVIFAAPMSLCLMGYFSLFAQPNATLVYIMLSIAAISYIYASINMLSLLKLKFYPTYAAFTFPYVISALAFRSANAFLVQRGVNCFRLIPPISAWIAVAAVVYVLLRYVKFIISAPAGQEKNMNNNKIFSR